MKIFPFFLLLFSLVFAAVSARASEQYVVANLPTPMFNTPDIASIFGAADGRTLKTDSCGQLRQLEFIALPGTVFTVAATLPGRSTPVYRVTTADYPYPAAGGYFIDSRFVRITDTRPPDRPRRLPDRQTIIERLLAARGSIYVWGGNIRAGIPSMFELYPPANPKGLPPKTSLFWQLRGVDCSGLLYEATDGFTPRNTSSLVAYGKAVPVAGLTTSQIVRTVEPLDLIVWKGHVLIILDRERVIESYLNCTTGGGVRVRPLAEALDDLRTKRMPVDAWPEETAQQGRSFVIRRWYGVTGTSAPS